jgi:hypothetical protein
MNCKHVLRATLFNKQSQMGLTQYSKGTHLTAKILFAYLFVPSRFISKTCNFDLDLNALMTVGGIEEILKFLIMQCSPRLIKLPYSNKEMHKLGEDFLFNSGI